MKKMKKVFALLIALVMVLGMGTMVFAEQTTDSGKGGSASITIKLPTNPNTDEDPEITYTVYKVFDATNDGTSNAIAYQIDSTNGDLTAAMTAAGFSVDTAGNVSGPASLDAAALAAIAGYAVDKIDDFNDLLINTVFESAEHRSVMSDYDKDNEPFPFDDFIFDDLIYDAAYQLSLGTKEGLANGYLWLLLGSFLRNEVGSLLKMYHSGFIAINRQPSEKGTLLDKLNFMFNPNEYEATYSGSDFDKKYPGTTWKCDNCGEILDYQDGFDDHYEFWQCRRCGHLNRIAIDQIYDNEETYLNGGDPVDSDQFYEALAERNMQEEITDDATYKQAIDIIESRPYKQAVMYTPYGNGYLVIAETIEAGDSQYYLYFVDNKGNATLKDASDIEDYHELEFYDLI